MINQKENKNTQICYNFGKLMAIINAHCSDYFKTNMCFNQFILLIEMEFKIKTNLKI